MNGIESLLEPQEQFDALADSTRRRFGRRVMDLSYANPYDGPPEEVMTALRSALDEERELAFQYTPFGGRTVTRRRIATSLRTETGLPFEYQDIVMTPGAMSALNVTFRTLFGADDEVLILNPCWLDYPLYLRHLGIPFRMVPCGDDKHIDAAAVERAITPRTRGLLFSQPCCPTGVLYPEPEIAELTGVLASAERRFGSSIYLLSDESHAGLVWSGAAFTTPLAHYARAVRIYSFGKVLYLQGQRIGYAAVSPRMPERQDLRKALERGMRVMGYCTPTAVMQRAICSLLDYRPRTDEIAGRQQAVRRSLGTSGYEVCDGDATLFVYVKSPFPGDFDFVRLLAAEGVLALPSSVFHEPGYFRISVTPRWESLAASFPVFERVLRQAFSGEPCFTPS